MIVYILFFCFATVLQAGSQFPMFDTLFKHALENGFNVLQEQGLRVLDAGSGNGQVLWVFRRVLGKDTKVCFRSKLIVKYKSVLWDCCHAWCTLNRIIANMFFSLAAMNPSPILFACCRFLVSSSVRRSTTTPSPPFLAISSCFRSTAIWRTRMIRLFLSTSESTCCTPSTQIFHSMSWWLLCAWWF